jgi:hypothetical protein
VKPKKPSEKDGLPPPGEAISKAKKYFILQEMIAKVTQAQAKSYQPRRFPIYQELMEVNGQPVRGAQFLNLSAAGARLRLPFAQPQQSQITLKFTLPDHDQTFAILGRVLWSRPMLEKGWHELEIQFYQYYWEIDQILRSA